jgi:UPF0042 nucleotide-binding protein
MKIFIISGLSGSGKTITLNALEDEGYYCIDSLPVGLLAATVQNLTNNPPANYKEVALGIDPRSGNEDIQTLEQVVDEIKAAGHKVTIVYLQASEDVLIKRFSETRRKHPLTHEGLPLLDAIHSEKEMLQNVAALADLTFDTSRLNIHELTMLVHERTHPERLAGKLSLLIQSFGFKHGVPLDSDFVFDLRCLPNPYWEPKLRPHTGLDKPVQDFLAQHEEVEEMFKYLDDFMRHWVPRFVASNRSYVTLSVGCTGGLHRSVYIADRLGKSLSKEFGDAAKVQHRELK